MFIKEKKEEVLKPLQEEVFFDDEKPLSNDVIIEARQIGQLIKEYELEIEKGTQKTQDLSQQIKSMLEKALKENSNDIYIVGLATKFYKLQCDTPLLISLLKKRLELDPNNESAKQELDRLIQRQETEVARQKEKIEKNEFFKKYNELKSANKRDELELLLRDRISKCPKDLISQNQLAGFLLDKLANDVNNVTLIREIRGILCKLRETSPNNLAVLSNMIRLAKLCQNKQAMEKSLRELILLSPGNYKAKTQLARFLIEEYKENPNKGILEEAEKLLEEVLDKYPDNLYALGLLSEMSRIKKNIYLEEALLRRRLDLEPTNSKLKTMLAGTLLEICYQKLAETGNIDPKDHLLLEAQGYLQEQFEADPQNLYVITYLIKVAKLQARMSEAIRLLKLKLGIDSNDIRAREDLQRLEKEEKDRKRQKKNNDYENKARHYTKVSLDYFAPGNVEEENSPSQQGTIAEAQAGVPSKKDNQNIMLLYNKLIHALGIGSDRHEIATILNLMLDEIDNFEIRKKIKAMIEKTKTTKPRTRFALKEEAMSLNLTNWKKR